MKNYNQKDICIVIPTYNRAEDLDRTLSTLYKTKNSPGKIVIVDQSTDNKTKLVAKKFSKNFSIKYIFSSVPSSSVAENIGVKEGKKDFELLLIAGDDLDFYKGYLNEMASEFNDPKVMGVGGADVKTQELFKDSFKRKLADFFFKIFLLPHKTKNKFKIIGPYGNTIDPVVKEPIRDAQWVPGFNNCFRRKVYEEYSFPEIKGYNVLEDIDCSYRVFRKYGKGSLVISPKYKVYHRYSTAARYPEKKRIFTNHEDHFSFYFKYFNTPFGTLKMIWSLTGIIFGNSLRLLTLKKEGCLKFLYNLQAIWYCITNIKSIKKGKLRSFLNTDLTMVDKYK